MKTAVVDEMTETLTLIGSLVEVRMRSILLLAQLVLSESWAAKADAYVGMNSCSMEWEQVSEYYAFQVC